jgi:SAM-dependent methyltransferase
MDPINTSRAQAIDGWMSEDELQWLGEQASECDRLIEVGCFLGRSTVVLAEHVRKQAYAVDPWDTAWKNEVNGGSHHFFQKHPNLYQTFKDNTEDFWKSGKLSIFRGDLKQLPIYRTDMVFIDGSHLYANVVSDCREGFLRLRNGGLLSGHDYGYPSWPYVKSVVDRIFGSRVTNPVGSIWAVRV